MSATRSKRQWRRWASACAALVCAVASPVIAQERTIGNSLLGPEAGTRAERAVCKTTTTTVRAMVCLTDGSPAANAVVVTSAGGSAVTNDDGVAHVPLNVDASVASIVVTVVATLDSVRYTGTAPVHSIVRGGQTDAGVITLSANGACEPAWLPSFGGHPGLNHFVHDLAVFDDGSGAGPALYAGGTFRSASGVPVDRIARWDGESWAGVGGGTSITVSALTVFDDGFGPALYVGGNFIEAGGMEVNRIARWDGEQWSPLGEGVNGWVRTLAVFDDGSGSGPALYAGGEFTVAGGVEADSLARWDGQAWSEVGGGVSGGTSTTRVYALTVFDDGSGAGPALYVGGHFIEAGGTEANHIARWDGQSWSPLDSGVSEAMPITAVYVIREYDDEQGDGPVLFVGGQFTMAGDVQVNHIARWDGSAWSALGSGVSGSISGTAVLALLPFDDGQGDGMSLYVGGSFTAADGLDGTRRIARWHGPSQSWSSLGGDMGDFSSGSGGSVITFAIFDDPVEGGPTLYAAGGFYFASGKSAGYIAKWDGSLGDGGEWVALGGGMHNTINDVAVFDDGSDDGPAIYACGHFTVIDDEPVNCIAKWDGVRWIGLNGGLTFPTGAYASALAVYDDGDGPGLYVGGRFDAAGGIETSNIARWDGTNWSSLAGGLTHSHPSALGSVRSLAVFDDGLGDGPALYAGGFFIMAGELEVNRIARWNGQSWSDLAGGVNERVLDMEAINAGEPGGPALYAGGMFRFAGGVSAERVAKWDGQSWSPLGNGIDNSPPFPSWPSVDAVHVFDDGSGAGPALYVGGRFDFASGIAVNNIARWDIGAETWSALGSGFNAHVHALSSYDDGTGSGPDLYAGGEFTIAGGTAVNRVARWDGASWSPLGAGIGGRVNSLLVFDNGEGDGETLYVAGAYALSPAGDSFIARWGGCNAVQEMIGDLNDDGAVNLQDLFILINEWGECDDPTPGNCPADLNGDGKVGLPDLVMLLNHWTG